MKRFFFILLIAIHFYGYAETIDTLVQQPLAPKNTSIDEVNNLVAPAASKIGVIGQRFSLQTSSSAFNRISQRIYIEYNKLYLASENNIDIIDINTGEIEHTINVNISPEIANTFGIRAIETTNIIAGPIVANNLIVVIDESGLTLAFDKLTHRLIWTHEAQLLTDSAQYIAQTDQIVLHTPQKIFFLDAQTGQVAWEYEDNQHYAHLKMLSKGSWPIVGNTLIAGLDSGNLVALNLETQKQSWYLSVNANPLDINQIVDIDLPIFYNPFLKILFILPNNNKLSAFRITQDSITSLWKAQEASNKIHYGFLYNQKQLLTLNDELKLKSYDANLGSNICEFQLDKNTIGFTRLTAWKNLAFFSNKFSDLYWFSPETCQQIAYYPLNEEESILQPVVHNDSIYTVTKNGTLYAIDIVENLKNLPENDF